MRSSRAHKTHYSEKEAARELGVTVGQLREMMLNHIVDRREDLRYSPSAIYHASDLLILKLLSGRPAAPTNLG